MQKGNIDNVLIISSIVIFAILGALIVLFITFVKHRNKLLKKQFESKLNSERERHKIELQALRSQMDPHFVHNSLNAIQYYIQRNEVDLSEKYLTKFSRLIRSFFELSRQEFIAINQEIELLSNYLDIEKLRFEDKLEYTINQDKELEEELIPTMLLQPLVENAINHGIFHKKGKGHITINFRKNEGSIIITILDDGIGLKRSQEIFNRSGKQQDKRSSSVLTDRLQLLEYSQSWRVNYTLKDRSDTQGAIATLQLKPLGDNENKL